MGKATDTDQGLSSQAVKAPRWRWSSWSPDDKDFCIVILVSPIFMFALFSFLEKRYPRHIPPRYYAAIDAVSGLDPAAATDLGHRPMPPLEPVFNLTMRVASVSKEDSACVYPGMYVEVFYRTISLAASATATEQLCAGPMNAAEQHVVARGAGVVVPGTVLASLAEDMRNGVQLFEVSLRSWGGVVLPCWHRRVGDDDALRRECALRWYNR